MSEENKNIKKVDESENEHRIEADLHRFSIGSVFHEQYRNMEQEYERWVSLNMKMEYPAMATMHSMVRAQARVYPELLKQYDDKVQELNARYGDIAQRRWDMRPMEATLRKELLENLLIDLGPSRIDERPQPPKYKTYDESYGVDGRRLIWDFFQKRLSENRNLNILFSGKVGGGKSYASLSASDFLIKGIFDLNNLTFDIPAFISRTREGKPGDVITLDEAGISAGSKDSMTKGVKSLSKVIQSTRYLQLCTIFTLPNVNFLDKSIRYMIDIIFDHVEGQRQGEFNVLIPQLSDDGKDVALKPLIYGGRIARTAFFPLPKPSLIQEYERIRKQHNLLQLAELQEGLEDDKESKGSGRGKNPNSRKNLKQYKGDDENE